MSVVRTRHITDRVQRSRADHLSLHALSRVARLLDERLAECRGAFEILAVVGDRPGDLERPGIGGALDRDVPHPIAQRRTE